MTLRLIVLVRCPDDLSLLDLAAAKVAIERALLEQSMPARLASVTRARNVDFESPAPSLP